MPLGIRHAERPAITAPSPVVFIGRLNALKP